MATKRPTMKKPAMKKPAMPPAGMGPGMGMMGGGGMGMMGGGSQGGMGGSKPMQKPMANQKAHEGAMVIMLGVAPKAKSKAKKKGK